MPSTAHNNIVPARTLAAEQAAAAGLALIQTPALWAALDTLRTLLDHASAAGWPDELADAGTTSADEADAAAELLTQLDGAARRWAMLAYPTPFRAVPVLGVVT